MTNLIQITDPKKINDKWFLHCRQYSYEDTSVREDSSCDRCKGTKWLKHYRVVIDDIDYYIPSTMAVKATRELTEEEQQVEKTYYKDAVTDELEDDNGNTDYVQGAKKYLDVDIGAKKRSDQADYEGETYLEDISQESDDNTTRGEEVGE